ncbi:MAG TPA: sigma-54 dependent transcriptional regulator [Armatimonadota bacterium]|mgnify:CR=1 FL=1|nr:sigma-54 dependent transcriptional regulator [Armatimonadota bacterium]HPP73589.1 sigma-54 dependent transcriptional regulator [Armatimonadota bacterium]
MARILLVDEDPSCRTLINDLLTGMGHIVVEVQDGRKAASNACSLPYDLVILDLGLPKVYGRRAIKAIKEECPDLAILVMTSVDTASAAVDSLKLGAWDYILKPLNTEEISLKVDRILERLRLISQNRYLQSELLRRYGLDMPIGKGQPVTEARSIASQVAPSNTPVLICGEPGTGKEYLARAIHYQSKRANGQFVKVRCSGLSETELEDKLFGLSSNNSPNKVPWLELAHGGTIFFTEIAYLSAEMQAALVQVLKEKRFVRPDGAVSADVRLVAATDQDLALSVESGNFNADLYKLLSKSVVTLPPLRERREDIPTFVDHFIKKYAAETGRQVSSISSAALEQIIDCEWLGNISELENCIERCVMVCDSNCIQPGHLIINGIKPQAKRKSASAVKSLRDVERDHIKRVLTYCDWNRSAAANILEIDRKTLRSKIREFGFIPPTNE